jgi:DNA-binding NarL/FixJ family response regulator
MLTAPRIHLIIADDHDVIVAGVKGMISRHRNLECVGSAANGNEVVDHASRLRPDVVIMDITMPSCDGFGATSRLRKEVPDTRVLVFSGHFSPSAVLAALRAGALGFVCKSSHYSVLIEAIPVVALGKRFIDPALSDPVLRSLLNDEPIGTPSTLTPREHEVLLRVAWGFTNNDIGTELGLSTKTAEGYRARACEKLSLADRPAIVKYALMAGWMDERAG